jgi:hypothetical protein
MFAADAWLTLVADFAVWGMEPRGYHLTSLARHAACAVAVFFLVVDLVVSARPGLDARGAAALPWAALAGALLFALHPLRVEPVAWATERRGRLSGLLLVLAVRAYLRAARGRDIGPTQPPALAHGRYGLAILWYAASLLSKELGFTLPLVFLVLDVYPLRRWRGAGSAWPLVVEKAPFFALEGVAVAVAMHGSGASGLTWSMTDYTFGQRLAQCFYGLAFYLWKTVLPAGLSALYPMSRGLDPAAPRFELSAVAVSVFTAGLVLGRTRWPAPLAAWACAVILLSPVLGLAQSGWQIAADRYTSLPAVGLSTLVAGCLTHAWSARRRALARRAAGGALVCAGLVALAVATWRQAGVWQSSETLWRHGVAADPDNVHAHPRGDPDPPEPAGRGDRGVAHRARDQPAGPGCAGQPRAGAGGAGVAVRGSPPVAGADHRGRWTGAVRAERDAVQAGSRSGSPSDGTRSYPPPTKTSPGTSSRPCCASIAR